MTLLVKDANTTIQSLATEPDGSGNLVPLHAPASVVAGGVAQLSKAAPEFPDHTQWLQSKPLTLGSLHGNVVVLHFWTNGCINCIHNYPVYKAWQEKYAGQAVKIIGVHTPELDFERDLDQLRREVAGLGIKYPVVTDQDYSTWKAYKVEAWPTVFLFDKQGRVRWTHVGEGYYDETEAVFKNLLA